MGNLSIDKTIAMALMYLNNLVAYFIANNKTWKGLTTLGKAI